jgi:hypothetical protein
MESLSVSLDDVRFLAGHRSARATKLYDRRQKKVTRKRTVEPYPGAGGHATARLRQDG